MGVEICYTENSSKGHSCALSQIIASQYIICGRVSQGVFLFSWKFVQTACRRLLRRAVFLCWHRLERSGNRTTMLPPSGPWGWRSSGGMWNRRQQVQGHGRQGRNAGRKECERRSSPDSFRFISFISEPGLAFSRRTARPPRPISPFPGGQSLPTCVS